LRRRANRTDNAVVENFNGRLCEECLTLIRLGRLDMQKRKFIDRVRIETFIALGNATALIVINMLRPNSLRTITK